jgi:Co/Zn/Cd efflux system component
MFAEKLKAGGEVLSRRTQIALEVVVPAFSMLCLIGVTAYIAVDAVNVLVHTADADEIDVAYLYGFATANAVVDISSSYIFFRVGFAADVFYTHTVHKVENAGPFQATANGMTQARECPEDTTSTPAVAESRKINLNMMSAFTHLTGDSLRTASVFIAALVSTFSGVPSQICDAWAAIAVTVSIVFMVIPLIIEIGRSCRKFCN